MNMIETIFANIDPLDTAVLVSLAVCTFFLIAIINIRSKRSLFTKDKDFLTPFFQGITKMLSKSKSIMEAELFCIYSLIAGYALLVIGMFMGFELSLCIVLGAMGLVAPALFVSLTASSNNKKFEEKYARALKNLSASLRAGLTIMQAIDELCRSPFIDEDIQARFNTMNAKIKMGMDIAVAFREFAEEVNSDDARDVASAMKMQLSVGGSEAAVIENVTRNINERLLMRKEIDAAFSDAKMTVIVFEIIPPLIIIGMFFMMGDIMMTYFDSMTGIVEFAAICIALILGTIINMLMYRSVKNV